MGGIKGRSSRLIPFGVAFLVILISLWGCPDAAIVLDAIKKAETAYTVTYNANGAMTGRVPVDSTNYLEGAKVTVLGNSGGLAKTDYNFVGWNMRADGSGSTYTQGQTFTMGSANVTLYAMWTASSSSYSITGTITLNATGLSGVTVIAGSASAMTNSSGGYTISGLSDGTYTVTPSLSGYAFTPSSQSVTVAGANIGGVNFTAAVSAGSAKWDQAKWDQDLWGN